MQEGSGSMVGRDGCNLTRRASDSARMHTLLINPCPLPQAQIDFVGFCRKTDAKAAGHGAPLQTLQSLHLAWRRTLQQRCRPEGQRRPTQRPQNTCWHTHIIQANIAYQDGACMSVSGHHKPRRSRTDRESNAGGSDSGAGLSHLSNPYTCDRSASGTTCAIATGYLQEELWDA